jgi:hypothetical protein
MRTVDSSARAVDPVMLAWLSSPKLNYSWGPQRTLRGLGDVSSIAGTISAVDPEPISSSAAGIISVITGLFHGGSPTADKIVPVQNQITTQVLAPISADVSMPQVKADPTVISHSDWLMLYNALTQTQTAWLNWLHNTQWPDPSKAQGAEATLAPYFSGLLADIMKGLQATGGVGSQITSIFTSTIPIAPVSAAGPGVAPSSAVYGPPASLMTSTAGFSTLVPVALAGLALWYFMGRKKHA